MKFDGDACAFMRMMREVACFWVALLFYFVEVYFGLYFAAVDVPPSSSSQALATRP